MLVVNTKEIFLLNLHQNRVHFPAERNAFVLDHQHGRRDVTCKPAINSSVQTTEGLQYTASDLDTHRLFRAHVSQCKAGFCDSCSEKSNAYLTLFRRDTGACKYCTRLTSHRT